MYGTRTRAPKRSLGMLLMLPGQDETIGCELKLLRAIILM
jgi:hypothetical protein